MVDLREQTRDPLNRFPPMAKYTVEVKALHACASHELGYCNKSSHGGIHLAKLVVGGPTQLVLVARSVERGQTNEVINGLQ